MGDRAGAVEDVVAAAAGGNPLARDLDEVLAHTGDLWERLRGARVFMTGGTGFVGCWLLETLLWANDRRELGASAVVLTRNARAFTSKAPHLASHPAVTLHDGDVRTFDFPAGAFSHVVHAGNTSSAPEPPDVLFDTIVAGTGRVLKFARECGARRFLLTSSGAVYGPLPADMTHVAEDYAGAPDTTRPANAYAEGKRAAETLCAVQAGPGLQPTIARCFAFVGPYLPLDAHFAVGNFLRDVLASAPIRVTGDGTPYRSYLYASDLAAWLWTILLRGELLRPYNVGSDDGLTIQALAEMVARLSSPALAVTLGKPSGASNRPSRYVPCTSRAREELGLQNTVPLQEGLARTLAWHRQAGAARC